MKGQAFRLFLLLPNKETKGRCRRRWEARPKSTNIFFYISEHLCIFSRKQQPFLNSYWSAGCGAFLQVSALASPWLDDCANFTPTPEENDQFSGNHSQSNSRSKPIHFYQQTNYTPLVISGNDKNKQTRSTARNTLLRYKMIGAPKKFKKWPRILFRPKTNHTCYQKPNSSRNTVHLRNVKNVSNYFFKVGIKACQRFISSERSDSSSKTGE